MNASARNYRKHAVLDDESPALVRAIHPEDKPSLLEAFASLDIESVRTRFFSPKASLSSDELEYFTEVDFFNHVAIGVGSLEEEQMIPIGIGRYIVDSDQPKKAEIALTVDEMYRGIGVGSLMLRHLCEIARENGIEKFHAVMLEDNTKMLHVLQRSQLPLHTSCADGVMEMEIDITKPVLGPERRHP